MALVTRTRVKSLAVYAAWIFVVGSLAGTTVLIALNSATSTRSRAMVEPTAIADSADKATKTAAVTVPSPANLARINEHLSSFIDSGDLPSFDSSASIAQATFVLNAGIEGPAYQSAEGLLSPIGAFDADSDAPQFQLARAAGIDLFSRGGGFGGHGSAGAGSGYGGASGAVSDVGAGASYTSSTSDSTSTYVASDSVSDLRAYEGSGRADDNRHDGRFDPPGRSETGGARSGGLPVTNKPGDTAGAFPAGGRVGGGPGGSVPATSVPEPSSLLLTGAGLVGLANAMRRRMAR
jgi:PEP-CTERM motif-containing protein